MIHTSNNTLVSTLPVGTWPYTHILASHKLPTVGLPQVQLTRVSVFALLSSCLFLTAVLLMALVVSGFEGLKTVTHIPLEHLPVLPLLVPNRHKVPTVVGLVLQKQRRV